MKIPFVAAITLVTHNLKPELGAEVLKKASELLQKYIDTGAWREVKLLVRFFGCLQAMFEGDGVFPLLEEFFARAVDLQTASSEDVSCSPILTQWPFANMFENSCSDWN
jgi:nuclear cap-binding protein subunit 1